MPVPKDDESEETPLSERLLDLLVFIPAGLAVTAVDELPKLAARGRERMGVRVSSARAVGQFAVKAGQIEFRRRSSALRRRDQGASEVLGDEEPEVADVPRPTPKTPRVTDAHRSAGTESVAAPITTTPPSSPATPPIATTPPTAATRPSTPAMPPAGAPVAATAPAPGNGHTPAVSSLAIPGFDSLSASQVVQRLDGLNRQELVSVRAYESSTRGRRTILNRVDQLLDERS
jgi:hypothetical protein